MPGKWTRRNLMALWDGQPHTTDEEREVMRAECDRIFIALYRFQTKGKVEYRRVCGLHGGGGGVKSEKVREIYTDKVNKDLYSNHQNGVFPGDSYWPFPTRNNPYPSKVNMDDPNYVYLYAWCWHGKVGFMPWHRPYVAEYERGMQEYDPRYDDDRRFGEDAIGLPYWAWEGWDGLTMPMVLSSPTYIIKTNDFEDKGFEIGSTIRNPFYRWWAPVSLEDQVAEYFPSKFNNHNTTTRAAGYTHLGEEFSEQWPLLSHGKDLSIKHEVRVSMSCPVWEDISDIGSGVNIMNLEHTHNQVHTRVGGREKGGLRGQGTQCFEYPDVFKAKKDENGEEMKDENGETIKEKKKNYFRGQMGDNQSAFDPIFWLHHCNVERQFCSWQRAHTHKGGVSAPSDEDMKIVLYPFTKPDLLFSGKLSHTTPSSDENDGTFADWWPHETLPYKFDNYLTSQDAELEESEVMILSVYFSAEDFDSGDYNVYHVKSGKKTKIGSVSILTNQGGTCASCAKRTEVDISLFVEEDDFKDKDAVQEAIDKNEFIIIHDEAKIKVTRAEVKIVKSSLPELKRLIVQQDA